MLIIYWIGSKTLESLARIRIGYQYLSIVVELQNELSLW